MMKKTSSLIKRGWDCYNPRPVSGRVWPRFEGIACTDSRTGPERHSSLAVVFTTKIRCQWLLPSAAEMQSKC